LIQLDHSSKEINNVFLIGHEPLMSEMVHKFSKDVLDKFPTAALYCVSWNVDSWADAMHLLGSKVDFITPKSLLKTK
jgi:phosphohistidine phosphatase SixA